MTNPITLQLRQGTPAHAVAGVHDLDGRPVMLIRAEDPEHRGALTPDDGDTLTTAATMALDKKLPIVLLLASSGADANHGVAALDGWGRAARVLAKASGVVPILAGVTGPAVSGTALLIGLADVVVMAEDAYAFVSGPVPVRQMTGVQVDVEELGGASVHYRDTGAASIVVPQDDVLPTISDILRFLPNHNSEEPPFQPTADPLDRAVPEALDLLPDTPTGSYDVRDVIRLVADDEEFLELRAGWAGNLVTGLSSIGGKPVGIVANQPMAIAGTLHIPASE